VMCPPLLCESGESGSAVHAVCLCLCVPKIKKAGSINREKIITLGK